MGFLVRKPNMGDIVKTVGISMDGRKQLCSFHIQFNFDSFNQFHIIKLEYA